MALPRLRPRVVPVTRHLPLLLLALGCAGAPSVCLDGFTTGASYEWGTANGSDLARLIDSEADGVDSNYSGGSAGLALHWKLRQRGTCWGEEPTDAER